MGRPLRIVVPFRQNGAKSRLSSVLNPEERRMLAFAMLRDVLEAVQGLGKVIILTRPGFDPQEGGEPGSAVEDAEILPSHLDLNDALNELIERVARQGWKEDLLIVMADLALLEKKDIDSILGCPGDVVLCPGRYGGTNMILIRSPKFRTCYLGLSFPKHRDFARQEGLRLSIYESFRAGCDIDEPGDLVEVLLHGRGKTRDMLERLGFGLSEMGRRPEEDGPARISQTLALNEAERS